MPFPLRAVRFHASLWCQEAGRAYPAMVAPVVDGKGKFLALHRTWLTAGGAKAPVATPKKVLGRYRGGLIRLWRGGCASDPETGALRQTPRLAEVTAPVEVDLTEGIEDGLSVALACPEARVVVAGVALASMAAIRWPPAIGTIVY